MDDAASRINICEDFGEMFKMIEAGQKLEGSFLFQFNKLQLLFANTTNSEIIEFIEKGKKLVLR
jgi:hypothetical protein